MKKGKICSLIGVNSVKVIQLVKREIEKAILKMIQEDDFTTFYFSGCSEFEKVCYEILTELKSKYINIERVFCRCAQQKELPSCLSEFDRVVELKTPKTTFEKEFFFHACEMLLKSDYMLCYMEETNQEIIDFAQITKKPYRNLYD